MSLDARFFLRQAAALERHRRKGFEAIEDVLHARRLGEEALWKANLIVSKVELSTADLRAWRVSRLGRYWLREDVRHQLVLVHRSRVAGLCTILDNASSGEAHPEIPAGEYCYRIVPLAPGETLTGDISRFGRDLREWSFSPGTKEVLCPHWQHTDHGTVRCALLGVEVLSEDGDAEAKAMAHFGAERMADEVDRSWELADEIKVCPYNRETEDD